MTLDRDAKFKYLVDIGLLEDVGKDESGEDLYQVTLDGLKVAFVDLAAQHYRLPVEIIIQEVHGIIYDHLEAVAQDILDAQDLDTEEEVAEDSQVDTWEGEGGAILDRDTGDETD